MEIRYGSWTTTETSGKRLLCRCDCGTTRHVTATDLRSGRSKGCGCTGIAAMRKAQREAAMTHGMTRSTEFQIWTDMRRRCHDPRRPDFHRYGGRGISVCDEWRESFEAFYRDMGPRPDGLTLDRLHNDQGYSKQNCIWATRKRQDRNRRTNRIVEVEGVRMTLADAAEKYGIRYPTLLGRLGARGWPLIKALTTPVANNGKLGPRGPRGVATPR
jgi:hypothetical protein